MSGFDKGISMWRAGAMGVFLALGICTFIVGRVAAQQTEPAPWVAPDDAKKVIPLWPEGVVK